MKSSHLLNRPLVQHTIFWVLYFVFNVFRWGLYFDDFQYSFESNLVEFGIHLIIVYFNLYFLLPKFFPQKLTKYVSFLIAATFAVALIRILLTYSLVTTEIWKETGRTGVNLFDPDYFIAVFIGEIYVVGFTMAIKLGIDYVSSVRKTKELENKKMEAELSFLRSQIQPHFFFNTLNNLYSLTLTQSKKAPETILKLSEVMSYVIYEGKSKRVEVHKEIKHIHDYLDLEELRYSNKLEVDIEIIGSLDGYYMPPLILVPFIENCFKHGNTLSDKIPIFISIKLEGQRLTYLVRNEVNKKKEKTEKVKERGGIGLKNVKRRLNLLFHDDYTLEIHENEETFTTILSMPIYDKLLNS